MTNKMTRLMVSVPQDVRSQIDDIKKKTYYNKSYAELYRKIIQLGLEKMKEKGFTEDQYKL